MPYDPDWDYGFCGVEQPRLECKRAKHPPKPEPVVALYSKTRLVEHPAAVLGEGCKAIAME